MKKRFMKMQPNLKTATNEQLFNELMKRITKEHFSNCYFVDRSCVDFKNYGMHKADGSVLVQTKGFEKG